MHYKFLQYICFVDSCDYKLISNLPKNIWIIYRNYSDIIDIKSIIKLKNFCRNEKKKFILSNNIKLSIKLGLDGAYVPAFNKSLNVRFYKTKKNFIYLGSAHNINEIKIKEKQKINYIFLSPFFKKEKKLNPLGIYRFNILKKITSTNVVCLGGINRQNLKIMNMVKPFGIATISLFKN